MLKFLKYLILLLISPVKGWEDIAQSRLSPRRVFAHGLMPFVAVCGLTCVVPALYVHHSVSIWSRFMQMIVTMGAYFVTYFIAMFVFTSFAARWTVDRRLNVRQVSLFVSYNLAVLLLFAMIRNMLPVENALIDFLPVFDVLIMWKGARSLNIRQDAIAPMMLTSIACILIPPTLIGYIFGAIIN